MRKIMMLVLVALAFAGVTMSGTTGCKPSTPTSAPPDAPKILETPATTGNAAAPAETSAAPAEGKIAWLTDFDAALKQAAAEKKPVMVDFTAEWCGWCKKLDEDTWPDARVAELAAKFVCVKVDADAHQDLASKYASEGLPTIAFLKSTGETITTQVGFVKPDEMLAVMQGTLGK